MPTYYVSMDRHYDQIALRAAAETGKTVSQYIDAVIKTHLDAIDGSLNKEVSK